MVPSWVAVSLLALAGFGVLLLLLGLRPVRNDRIAVIEKRFSGAGSIEKGLIALQGEAGVQPEVLRGGLHWKFPFVYKVRTVPLVTVPQSFEAMQ